MSDPIDRANPAHAARRDVVRRSLGGASALVFAGEAKARNVPANLHPFRASSHFLHLVGAALEGAVLWIGPDGDRLFVPKEEPDHALWHGETPSRAVLADQLGLPIDDLASLGRHVGDRRPFLLAPDPSAATARLGAEVPIATDPGPIRRALLASRLPHDAHAIAELRRAADATCDAHLVGMATTRPGRTTSEVRAAMEASIVARDMTCAYGSIVTPRGEVLHAPPTHVVLRHGDLLLCDVGAETRTGYAGDVTRTVPVNGRFDGFERELYEAVLATQREAIAGCVVGARFRDLHLRAMRSLAVASVALGLLRGDADERVADGSLALFFPHGLGHLLGLDVHDLEDFGDLAGYADGRVRSTEPGLRYLRLDRDLAPDMVVTIEPGMYFVPAILDDPAVRARHAGSVDFARVDAVRGLGGIRIEDDVRITDGAPEVLTERVPKDVDALEAILGSGAAGLARVDRPLG